MLTRLKRLLGWERDTGARRAGPSGRPKVPAPRPAARSSTDPRRPSRSEPKPDREPDLADLLGAPSLSLDTTDQDGFDPYNTGVFDRSASWDRISKNQR